VAVGSGSVTCYLSRETRRQNGLSFGEKALSRALICLYVQIAHIDRYRVFSTNRPIVACQPGLLRSSLARAAAKPACSARLQYAMQHPRCSPPVASASWEPMGRT